MASKRTETRNMFQKIISGSGSGEKRKGKQQGSTSKAIEKHKETPGSQGSADEQRRSLPPDTETETPRKRLRSPGHLFETEVFTPAWRQQEEISGI